MFINLGPKCRNMICFIQSRFPIAEIYLRESSDFITKYIDFYMENTDVWSKNGLIAPHNLLQIKSNAVKSYFNTWKMYFLVAICWKAKHLCQLLD